MAQRHKPLPISLFSKMEHSKNQHKKRANGKRRKQRKQTSANGGNRHWPIFSMSLDIRSKISRLPLAWQCLHNHNLSLWLLFLKKKIRIRNYHRNKSLIHIIGSSQYLLSWSFSEVYPLHFQASLWLKGDKLSTSNNVKLLSKPKKFCVANFFQVMFYYTI